MESENLTIRINPVLLKRFLKIAVAIVVVVFLYDFFRGVQANHAGKKAEDYLRRGLPAMAAEEADAYRERLAHDERGCSILLQVFMGARRTEKVEWAVEACLQNGVNSFEIAYARADVLARSGQGPPAVSILQDAKRFRNWMVYPSLIKILMRDRKSEQAVNELREGLKLYPDVIPLKTMGMQLHMDLGHWREARRIADDFKQPALEGKMPEGLKNDVAIVFEKSGDAATAKQIRQASAWRPQQQQPPQQQQQQQQGPGGATPAPASAPNSSAPDHQNH